VKVYLVAYDLTRDGVTTTRSVRLIGADRRLDLASATRQLTYQHTRGGGTVDIHITDVGDA
jgi:hypothetical protein